MKSLLIATTNQGKVREVAQALSAKYECLDPNDPRFKGLLIPHVIEDGDTYQEHALRKAKGFFQTYQIPVLSDDSGLEIDALGGAPGVHTAYYGGETLSWPERWAFVHQQLKTHHPQTWTARFRCVLCYYDGKEVPRFFEGTAEGKILPGPVGKEGFGYDPIFFSNELKKGFGEASTSEKQTTSHRGKALKAFLAWSPLDHPTLKR